MEHYQHGLIVGKFMPLHNGHVYLVETALQHVDSLTIVLMSQPTDPISGATRHSWLSVAFPAALVKHHDTPLPRDETGYGHWDQWRDSILRLTGQNFDVVFSSEVYGARLATDLGAVHVLVDQHRVQVPVSARDIRTDPTGWKDFVPAHVWVYFDKS